MEDDKFVCPLREDRCPVFTREDADGIKDILDRIHDNQRELIDRDKQHDVFVKIGLCLLLAAIIVFGIV